MIRLLSAEEARAAVDRLAEVLLDAVQGGASVNFMAGYTRAEAVDYWLHIADDLGADRRVLLVAGDFDGTAQLILDMPPNQAHRCDLAKMLVHRRARRRGLGRALFQAACDEALRRGRRLIVFDTVAGSEAERLYLSCGAVKVGEIPDYALMPDGAPVATSVFFKQVR